jgi:quercetin dioxygenase-like cupin family protein
MTTRATFLPTDDGRRLSVLGTEMTVKASVDDTGGAYEVVVAECGPGGDIVPHRHPWQESYFVLAGTLEVQVGRRLHRAAPGAFLTIPPRALHGFRVLEGPARFLHISIGHGATALFDEYAELVPGEPEIDDLATIIEVNARHGVEVILPPEILELAAAASAGAA